MKINKTVIKKLKPCDDRFDNYLNYYKDFNGSVEDFVMLENITYDDKVWVLTRLATKKQNVTWSFKCALSVLDLFESSNLNDNRPRLALNAVDLYLNIQTKDAVWDAGDVAWDVARATDAAKTTWAAWAARAAKAVAWAAAEDAVDAAWDAAGAASAARNAIRAVAWNAIDARDTARIIGAAEKTQEELNLIYFVEVFNETKRR